MRLPFFFLFFLPLLASAQKMILVDRQFKRPAEFKDTTTLDDLFRDYFPMYVQDVNLVLKKTDSLIALIKNGDQQASIEDEIPVGNSRFIFAAPGRSQKHRGQLVLTTRTSTLSTSFRLFMYNDSRKRAVQKLLIFSDYVRNNLNGASGISIANKR